MRTNRSLYDEDFYAWSNQQAALLRAGKLSEADIENIAEEIESMGKSEKRELVSRLIVLLQHLLKWQFQGDLRGRSWRFTVIGQRAAIAQHLEDNPSLKSFLGEVIRQSYNAAKIEAARETSLEIEAFPEECPYSLADIMSGEFWPDERAHDGAAGSA